MKSKRQDVKNELLKLAIMHYVLNGEEYFRITSRYMRNCELEYFPNLARRILYTMVSAGVLVQKRMKGSVLYKYNYFPGKRISKEEQQIYNEALKHAKS